MIPSRAALAVLVLALVATSGCTSPPAAPVPEVADPAATAVALPIADRAFSIGVAGFVPAHAPDSSAADWEAFFTELPETGELFGVYAAWDDTPTEGIPQQVSTAFALGTVEPVVALGFEVDSLTQEEADQYIEQHGAAFTAAAVAVAQTFTPRYLALGVESNRYYEKSPSGFADFVTLYKEAYDQVKAVSPGTKVFTIFQLEYLKGGGALSGAPHDPHPQLITQFDGKLDLLGLTVYPFLDSDTPGDLPAGYFADVAAAAGVPILITETGWPSEPVAGVQGSEQAQVDYLLWLLEETDGLELEGIVWVFPHDSAVPVGGGLFDHLSLRTNAGQEKQAFAYWQALQTL